MSIRTVQSLEVWLPRTQPWIRNQLRFLPEEVQHHIVCQATANLDEFQAPNIVSLADQPLPRQILDRALRFLRFRHHLGFLRRQILELAPDLLHSHFGHIGWQDLGAVRGTGARHVVTFYGQDLSWRPAAMPRWRDRYRGLFDQADLFLCEGPHMAGELARLGCPEDRIAVHRLGVDLDRIEFRPRRWSPDEPLRVLMASSFREKKGIPYGIEALGRLRGSVPLELTVIGDAVDQPGSRAEKRRILEAVDQAGLQAVTRFPGFLTHDRLLDEAYAHHLFLAPSVTAHDGDTEGGAPVSLIEMAAAGMPIATTRHCDIPQVVLEAVNAALADERDPDGLAEGIRALLHARDEWPARLAEGRRHVERRFDAAAQGRALADLYRKVVDA